MKSNGSALNAIPGRGALISIRVFTFASLFLLLVQAASTPVLAQRGRIEQDTITSDALTNNLLGDAATHPYKVYLPPSYDTTQKRYPTIYVLHGWSGSENDMVGYLFWVVS